MSTPTSKPARASAAGTSWLDATFGAFWAPLLAASRAAVRQHYRAPWNPARD